jgi:hypothetical protein
MEVSSPYSRNTRIDREGGGNIRTYTSPRSKNAQETKDKSEEATVEERGDIQDKSPYGEEEQHTFTPSTVETS